jgi:ArsR family transcriptional regulator, arsenate/arsenite/antimonite-responsive transcriptional repressor
MIYSARYETMNALIAYLTENCCQGRADQCMPIKGEKAAQSRSRRKELVT